MADIGDILQKGVFIDVLQFHAADGGRTGIALVPPHEDGGDGGFPTSAFPNQGGKAALVELQIHAV